MLTYIWKYSPFINLYVTISFIQSFYEQKNIFSITNKELNLGKVQISTVS